jgi:hypothetical protein
MEVYVSCPDHCCGCCMGICCCCCMYACMLDACMLVSPWVTAEIMNRCLKVGFLPHLIQVDNNLLLNKNTVTLVLRHVGQKQRFTICAIVCSTWHQAAEDATTEIKVYASTQAQVEGFLECMPVRTRQTSPISRPVPGSSMSTVNVTMTIQAQGCCCQQASCKACRSWTLLT